MNGISFEELGVDPRLISVLNDQGITEPFEIQRESIPHAIQGRDVCCRAPTGSGKTLAFGLPLLSRCKQAQPFRPTALILTPTRELAEQICSVLIPLGGEIGLQITSVYGGVSYSKQRRSLEKGVDIVVACPGRLIDLMDQGAVEMDDVDFVVLDEADRMADMGFIEPVCHILDHCSSERQTILLSATLDDEVGDVVEDYQDDPVMVEVGPEEVSMDQMDHFFWLARNSVKSSVASDVIKKCGRSIVFCRTRAGVDRVGNEMREAGLRIVTLHGGLTQRNRDRAMERFIDGKSVALIATDVAARGIDVEGVQSVIHYDPPENGKAYKHRSGRTARAGAHGIVISLVQKPQRRQYGKIQKNVGIQSQFTPPDLDALPEHEFIYTPPDRKKEKQQNRPSKNRNRSRRSKSSYYNKGQKSPHRKSGGRPSSKRNRPQGGGRGRKSERDGSRQNKRPSGQNRQDGRNNRRGDRRFKRSKYDLRGPKSSRSKPQSRTNKSPKNFRKK